MSSLGDILPLAVGVAISPLPVVAVILMLFSPQAGRAGPAFLLGWVIALIAVSAVVLLLADAGRVSGGGTPSAAAYAVKLALGVLLLALAWRQWRSRPREGEQPKMPKWMAGVDAITAGKAFGLALLLAGVNPKNLALTVAAALSISQSGAGTAPAAVLVAVFVVIGSAAVAAPVVYYLAARSKAEKTLQGWKAWLSAHNSAVMAVLFLVLGAKLAGQGLGGLL